MATTLSYLPQMAFQSGEFAPGAKAYFYQSGTTTPVTVYQDSAYTTPHASPVVANSAGVFPVVYYNGPYDVKSVVTGADDTAISTIDPIVKLNTSLSGADGISFSPITGNDAEDVQNAIENNTTARTGRSTDVQSILGAADVAEVVDLLGLTGAAPTGTPMLWLTDTAPVGWLLATGQAVSRTTYADLFSVIGETFGNGDGSTTFNLPDPSGLFPRFTDNGAGVDPDAASRTDRGDGATGDVVGTKQDEEIKSHNHSALTGGFRSNNASETYQGGGAFNSGLDATTASTGGSETRPVNMYFNMIIKT